LLSMLLVGTISSLCAQNVYDFNYTDIVSKPQSMAAFKGKVLLIVNVASTCAKTGVMYPMLQKLYTDYKDKGFRILACPCNQWMEEQGTEPIIKAFVENLGITFNFTSKMDVNGPTAHALWKYLKKNCPRNLPGLSAIPGASTVTDEIEWNFGMILCGKDGKPVAPRCTPDTTPLTLGKKIEELLK